MNGPCDDCKRDSSDARRGGGLWLPPDSDPIQTLVVRTRKGATVRNRQLCADCRAAQDDGESPWRSA